MSLCSRIGLGTVQWGMSYGIANRSGKPTLRQVANMLLAARERGISLLDTSYAYGEAEKTLGELGAGCMGFQIVTKTMAIRAEEITAWDAEEVAGAFRESLRRLGCEQVYALLVHGADDLLAKAGERLWKTLEVLRSEGSVRNVGVSVYHPRQLETILDHYPIEVVQLPFNIYDQRFKRGGLLSRLKGMGIEVHSRSAFLQGLLLLPPERLPARFYGIHAHHAELYERFRDLELSPSEACLLYCLQQPDIDRVIVGCETLGQLEDVLRISTESRTGDSVAFDGFQIEDESILNPSAWNQ